MAKAFGDMSEEEKKEAYETWLEGRQARRGQSKVRRQAARTLVEKYPDEYAQILARLTPKAK